MLFSIQMQNLNLFVHTLKIGHDRLTAPAQTDRRPTGTDRDRKVGPVPVGLGPFGPSCTTLYPGGMTDS